MDAIKILVIIVLFAIVGSLGSALLHLSRGRNDPTKSDSENIELRKVESAKMARALTFRIGLSVVLFILLMLAYYNGLIEPNKLGH